MQEKKVDEQGCRNKRGETTIQDKRGGTREKEQMWRNNSAGTDVEEQRGNSAGTNVLKEQQCGK
jgi:hypothetical protein